MRIAPGDRLGSYEVLGPLGVGGMGEVWRAWDPNLGREVAIKVLPEGFAEDPGHLRRFQQEAQALAALSHPGIVQVHDAGQQEGRHFLVMELVMGETLRQRLAKGRLPWRKAVELAAAVAEGLAAAHAKGIVHRDLKPENLVFSEHGHLKILDFGLAKVQPEALGEGATLDTAPLRTLDGALLGTVGYMSPEQVQGQPADARSDVFALGCVLYEMLTGRRAFERPSEVETLAAVLKDPVPEPGLSGLGDPPELERILGHCLEKDPADRFQTAKDLAFALESIRMGSIPPGSLAIPTPLPRRLLKFLWVGGLAGVALAGGWIVDRNLGPPPPPTFTRLSTTLQKVESAYFGADGRRVFFSARTPAGTVAVFDLAPGDAAPTQLDHGNALLLAVSPSNELALLLDPRHMFTGFRGTLAQAPPRGGVRPLQDLAYEAAWLPGGGGLASINELSDDGFSLECPLGVRRELAKISNPPKLLRVSRTGDAAFVAFDNRKTELVVYRGGVQRQVWATDAADGQGEALTGLAWTPDGRELWCSECRGGQTSLWALTAHSRRLVWRVPGNHQLLDLGPGGRALVAAHRIQRGVLLQRAGAAGLQDIFIRHGTTAMDISRDGRRLLLMESLSHRGRHRQDEAYLLETEGGSPVRLCAGMPQALAPDGREALVYQNGFEDGIPPGLKRVPTGPGLIQPLTLPGLEVDSAVYGPDGRTLYAIANAPGRWMGVYRTEQGGPRLLTREGVAWWFGAFPVSPDGTRLVLFDGLRPLLYSTAGGAPRPIPGMGDAEVCLRWTEDGKGLFLFDRDRLPARVERLDLATGARREVARLMPPDPALYDGFLSVVMTPDARTLAYNYRRVSSELYLVEGLK